jgi:hypothetical protein
MTDSLCFIESFPVLTGLSTQCNSTDLDHAQAATKSQHDEFVGKREAEIGSLEEQCSDDTFTP